MSQPQKKKIKYNNSEPCPISSSKTAIRQWSDDYIYFGFQCIKPSEKNLIAKCIFVIIRLKMNVWYLQN